MKREYEGACHCGNVRFRARIDLDDSIVCDCSICRKKGTIANRVDEADFELLTDLETLGLYTFNKHIARHYFCRRCGVHPFHRPRSCPDKWAVNVRCLQDVDIANVDPRPVAGSRLD